MSGWLPARLPDKTVQTRVTTATRRLQFCAGHRVMGHENKCAHLHGHNYVALITATADKLDSVGRVIDFSVIKQRVGGWIEQHWDHGFIIARSDKQVLDWLGQFRPRPETHQKLFLMDANPTSENMARFLLERVCPDVLDGTGVGVTRVRLWETENCYAEAVA